MLILWNYMSPIPFFIRFNIFHGHSITKLFGNKKISIVWKPTTFCNTFLLDSTLENEFTQSLLISVMIAAGSSFISPLICSIWKVSISWFELTRYILYVPFCSADSLTCYNNVPQGTPKTTVRLWFLSHMYCKYSTLKDYRVHEPTAQE